MSDEKQPWIQEPLHVTEETARRLIDVIERSGTLAPVRHIRGNQVMSAVLGAIGVALFLVGVKTRRATSPSSQTRTALLSSASRC
ncbi:MAG TPA: hypothetical protein VIH21_11670 [Dehalococcoidia bacterium]